MCPFVLWIQHPPCLMRNQSHCSHTEPYSTLLSAIKQLAWWCHLKRSAVTVVNQSLDQQLLGTTATLTAMSSQDKSIGKLG